MALTRQRAFAGRERLVLERLQLGRGEALGIFHRLAALVVVGDLGGLALRDLDEIAVQAIELHPQRGDAAALALARFELEQEGVAVAADGAQLVELGVVAGGDDASVADERGRLLGKRADQQRRDRGGRRERLGQHRQQQRAFARHGRANARQGEQRRAQTAELARTGLAQGDARSDALDVGEMAQRGTQLVEPGGLQGGDCLVPLRRDAPLAQGLRQPVAQGAAAHAGAAAVERRQQRRRVLAAQGAGQLEVAVRRRRQVDQIAGALHDKTMDMGERATLRVLRVAEQRCRGRVRQVQVLGAEAGERGDLELRQELSCAEGAVELPLGSSGQGLRLGIARALRQVGSDEDLRRRKARDPAGKLAFAALGQADLAVRKCGPGQPERAAPLRDGKKKRIALVGEQIALRQRARSDDAQHLALDRALAEAHLADLFADRDRLAHAHQAREIALDRVHGHAGHGDRRTVACAACGQRDVEEPGGLLRVIQEELVEVAHPVEKERLGMVGLDAQVLLHHRRVHRGVGSPLCGGFLL